MKSFTLDWKGWWVFRTPVSDVPELMPRNAVYAIMGSKLVKTAKGIASKGREVVMFGACHGEPVREHLENLQKTALGVFALNRCKEIKKNPLIYVAALPDDTDAGDLSTIVSLLYSMVPFAPEHHAMPAPYEGKAVLVKNIGSNIALPEEIFAGSGDKSEPSLPSADETVDSAADNAMRKAIESEAAITRRMTQDEMDAKGIATEKLAKPNALVETAKISKEELGGIATERIDRPKMVETVKGDKEDIAKGMETEKVDKPEPQPSMVETVKVNREQMQGLETERVPKPKGLEDTEFVPKPESMPAEAKSEAEVLDEAGS
ncbi:MAG: hypothetical protein L3J82_05140 [Planctomycetes bacterium]|nr:hypothetical protein [Planctomycetota bacterium]